MEPDSPTPDDAPHGDASCPSCGAATAGDQRYCLVCGSRVGDRRLDPIEMLTPSTAVGGPASAAAAAAHPRPGAAPPGATAAAPRAVPLAAAAAAIVVAGVSGMLVTHGGPGPGARAAVIAAPAPAPSPEGFGADPRSAPSAGASGSQSVNDPPAADPSPPVVPSPAAPASPAEAPVTDDVPGDDASEDGDDVAADGPAPTPRVWLLALEGPRAADAVERVARQGVRLSGMRSVATTAQANATALVGGVRPAMVDPAAAAAPADVSVAPVTRVAAAAAVDPLAVPPAAAPVDPPAPVDPLAVAAAAAPVDPPAVDAAADAAPSLLAALVADRRTWRAYVDAQPTGGPVLPGVCAAPPDGDAAATLLASRLPFAAIDGIGCDRAVTSLEALGDDLSSGDDVPAFSYVAMGGCAAPERPAVALPDAVEDTVATITASTEYQQDGMLVVTTIGDQDACAPGTASPSAPALAPTAPPTAAPSTAARPTASPTAVAPAETAPLAAPAPAPTVVLRPTATAGRSVKTKLDLRALSRAMAEVLGVTLPAAGDDAVPTIALPGVRRERATGSPATGHRGLPSGPDPTTTLPSRSVRLSGTPASRTASAVAGAGCP